MLVYVLLVFLGKGLRSVSLAHALLAGPVRLQSVVQLRRPARTLSRLFQLLTRRVSLTAPVAVWLLVAVQPGL